MYIRILLAELKNSSIVKTALVINMINFINDFCLEISEYIEKEKIYNSLLIPENKNWRVD